MAACNVGRWAQSFSPSVCLVKKLAGDLDLATQHTQLIEPAFASDQPQMLKLESLYIAELERAEVIP